MTMSDYQRIGESLLQKQVAEKVESVQSLAMDTTVAYYWSQSRKIKRSK